MLQMKNNKLNLKLENHEIEVLKNNKPKQNDTKFMMEQLQMNIDQAL